MQDATWARHPPHAARPPRHNAKPALLVRPAGTGNGAYCGGSLPLGTRRHEPKDGSRESPRSFPRNPSGRFRPEALHTWASTRVELACPKRGECAGAVTSSAPFESQTSVSGTRSGGGPTNGS